ncbi:hypothetical protein P20480_0470 [Pseudoalteromonas sp. BSi20480]|nr:hypothetical protein P20480_0470 [Pseudoalteromonas sp. BSi20480]
MDYSLSIFDNVLDNKCPLGHLYLTWSHFNQCGYLIYITDKITQLVLVPLALQ